MAFTQRFDHVSVAVRDAEMAASFPGSAARRLHSPRIPALASSRGEFHPPALSEPGVNLSAHPAPITQPHGRTPNCQWANRFG
jgi:hypothetical protein